jgi:hypothetical protein
MCGWPLAGVAGEIAIPVSFISLPDGAARINSVFDGLLHFSHLAADGRAGKRRQRPRRCRQQGDGDGGGGHTDSRHARARRARCLRHRHRAMQWQQSSARAPTRQPSFLIFASFSSATVFHFPNRDVMHPSIKLTVPSFLPKTSFPSNRTLLSNRILFFSDLDLVAVGRGAGGGGGREGGTRLRQNRGGC